MDEKQKYYRRFYIFTPIAMFLLFVGLMRVLPSTIWFVTCASIMLALKYWQYTVTSFFCPECGEEVQLNFLKYAFGRVKSNSSKPPQTQRLLHCTSCGKKCWMTESFK